MIPISYAAHYWYCQREFLNYLFGEKYFPKDNYDYTKSILLHEKIHSSGKRYKSGIKQLKNIELVSEKYQLSGKADMIEITNDQIYPVEFKSGAKRKFPNHEVQLILQALVLEDMLGVGIDYGYLSFSTPHERLKITFSEQRKKDILDVVIEIREKLKVTNPMSVFKKEDNYKCEKCSFFRVCY